MLKIVPAIWLYHQDGSLVNYYTTRAVIDLPASLLTESYNFLKWSRDTFGKATDRLADYLRETYKSIKPYFHR